MQFEKKSESLTHLTSRSVSSETISQSGLLIKFKTKWRRFLAGVLATSLVIASVIIGIYVVKLHEAHKDKSITKELGVFDKLVGEDRQLHSVNENLKEYKISPTSISILNNLVDPTTASKDAGFQLPVDKNALVHEEFEKKITGLQKQLQFHVNHAEHVMDTVANLTKRVSQIEDQVHVILTAMGRVNASVAFAQSNLQVIAQNTNASMLQLDQQTNETLDRTFQNIDRKLQQHAHELEHLVISFQMNTTKENNEMKERIYNYHQTVNHSLAKATNYSRYCSEELLSKEIQTVKAEFNTSLVTLNNFQTSNLETEKISLKNLVLNESAAVQSKLLSMQSELDTSSQHSSAARAQLRNDMTRSMLSYRDHFNKSLQTWIDIKERNRKSENLRLETLFNVRKQEVESLQNKVTLLDDQITANAENLDKLHMEINGFKEQLKGKADDGWIPTSSGFSYLVTKERVNWVAARTACESLNANLAHAGLRMSSALYQFIVSQTVRPLQQSVWIGLDDSKNENQWTWNDGSLLNRKDSHWRVGQPNNYKNQDCAEMDVNGLWGDLSCSGRVTAFALCEKNVNN